MRSGRDFSAPILLLRQTEGANSQSYAAQPIVKRVGEGTETAMQADANRAGAWAMLARPCDGMLSG